MVPSPNAVDSFLKRAFLNRVRLAQWLQFFAAAPAIEC